MGWSAYKRGISKYTDVDLTGNSAQKINTNFENIADRFGGQVWDVKSDFGAAGDGVTNDRDAINAALQAIFDAGGGVLYFPPGIYQVDGLLESTGYNSIIKVPQARLNTPEIMISIVGPGAAPGPGWFIGDVPPYTSGAIIRTNTAGSGANPALLAAAPFSQTVGLSSDSFSVVSLEIKDIGFRCPPNPSLAAIQCNKSGHLRIRNVRIDVDCNQADIPQPTSTDGVGIYTPTVSNPGLCIIDGITIQGYYIGFTLNEHTIVGSANCYNEYIAVYAYPNNLDSSIGRLLVVWCPYGIQFNAGGFHTTTISSMMVERRRDDWDPLLAWGDTVADIYDPSNKAIGSCRSWIQETITAARLSPIINGAKYFDVIDLANTKYSQPTEHSWFHVQSTKITGNLIQRYGDINQAFASVWFQTPPAQNDVFEHQFQLAIGPTYTLMILGATSTDCGIGTFTLDGVSIGTLDFYSAIYSLDVIKTLTFAIPTGGTGDGTHILRCTAATKNASSTDYKIMITQLDIKRNP